MEIKGIEDPFSWSRYVVQKVQKDGTGLYYSPNNTRTPSLTSENTIVSASTIKVDDLPTFGGYFVYVMNFINDLNKVFEFGDDWGMYIPEVKYLSPEPLVNYTDLSLNDKQPPVKKASIKTKALSNIQSEGLKNVMDDFFKS